MANNNNTVSVSADDESGLISGTDGTLAFINAVAEWCNNGDSVSYGATISGIHGRTINTAYPDGIRYMVDNAYDRLGEYVTMHEAAMANRAETGNRIRETVSDETAEMIRNTVSDLVSTMFGNLFAETETERAFIEKMAANVDRAILNCTTGSKSDHGRSVDDNGPADGDYIIGKNGESHPVIMVNGECHVVINGETRSLSAGAADIAGPSKSGNRQSINGWLWWTWNGNRMANYR